MKEIIIFRYECCPEPYVTLNFKFVMRRKYVVNPDLGMTILLLLFAHASIGATKYKSTRQLVIRNPIFNLCPIASSDLQRSSDAALLCPLTAILFTN
jgi:hypothetical protein